MNEQQMTTLVEQTGDSLEPDVRGLVAGGTARGRVRRRRRALGSALSGMVAVGAVAALGYSLVPGGDPVGTDDTSVASAATPTAAPASPTTVAERVMALDPDQTGRRLATLLEPEGAVTDVRAWSDDPDEFRAASVLLDGAQVTILVERVTLPACGEQPRGRACASVPGGHLSTATYEEPASGGGPSGILASTATLFTDDGFAIVATAWNAPGEKHVAPISARPVLSEQQLTALVNDAGWLTQQ